MVAFATADDVATRLALDLSDEQEAAAAFVIEIVTGLIAELAGESPASAEALDPVPAYYRALCVEKAVGAIANPENLAATSESLGAYSRSATFPRSQDVGIFLTEYEEQMVRRIANNKVSASTRTHSLLHDAYVKEA